MDDAQTRELRDDAPLPAWKHGDAVDAATDALIEPRGDQLFSSTVTINKPRSELFAYWRDFTKLPSFMDNLERVDIIRSSPKFADAGVTALYETVYQLTRR